MYKGILKTAFPYYFLAFIIVLSGVNVDILHTLRLNYLNGILGSKTSKLRVVLDEYKARLP